MADPPSNSVANYLEDVVQTVLSLSRFWFVAAFRALTVTKRYTLTNSIILIILFLRSQGFIQYIWNQPSLSITPTARLGKFEKLRSCYHLSLWFVMAFRAHIKFSSPRKRKGASNGRKLRVIPFSKRENDGLKANRASSAISGSIFEIFWS